MTMNDSRSGTDHEALKRSLNKELEIVSWGCS